MRHDDDGHAQAGGIVPTALFPEKPPPSEVASRAPQRVCRLFRALRTPTSRLGLYSFSSSIPLYYCVCVILIRRRQVLPRTEFALIHAPARWIRDNTTEKHTRHAWFGGQVACETGALATGTL